MIDALKPENVDEYRGRLHFALNFEKDISTLFVHVLEAMDLPIRDLTGKSILPPRTGPNYCPV